MEFQKRKVFAKCKFQMTMCENKGNKTAFPKLFANFRLVYLLLPRAAMSRLYFNYTITAPDVEHSIIIAVLTDIILNYPGKWTSKHQ